MKLDIVLAGVGGQGILTIANVLDHVSLAKNLYVKQAEIHGMSQRGGAVYSHLRISDKPIMSDLIPEGSADMLLSLEPLEVGRYLPHLNKNGIILTNSVPIKTIPNYPDENILRSNLFSLGKILVLDATALAQQAGSQLMLNMVMLGAATPFLPFLPADFTPVITKMFERKGEKTINANLHALNLGYEAGLLTKQLFETNTPAQKCFEIVNKIAQ